MALAARLETLDGLAEPIQAEYREVEARDGTRYFVLDVTPAGELRLQDASGLRTALEAERANARRASQYGDITPDAARTAVERVQQIEAELEQLRNDRSANRTERERAREAELVARYERELVRAQARGEGYWRELDRVLVQEAARRALRDAGFTRTADVMLPHITPSLRLRQGDDGFAVEVVGPSGGPRVGNGPNQVMTIAERALEMASDEGFRYLVDGTGSSGGGNTGDGGTPTPAPGGVRRVAADDLSGLAANFDGIADGTVQVVDTL